MVVAVDSGWDAVQTIATGLGKVNACVSSTCRGNAVSSARRGMPDEDQARAIFKTLHKNIYRAFDYKTESDIYDTLALSVDGQLLESIYNDLYLSLMQKVLGQAASRIQTVRILESRLLEEPAGKNPVEAQFRIWCCWHVHGSVRHWGHTHARTNEYEAVYTVGVRDGTWKIIATEVIRQEQVSEPI